MLCHILISPHHQATDLGLHLKAPPPMDHLHTARHPLATNHLLEALQPRQGRAPSFRRAPSSLTPLVTHTLHSSAASIQGQPLS